MTNKKPEPQMRRIAKGFDILVMTLFALGVLVVIALFIYVLSSEFSGKP